MAGGPNKPTPPGWTPKSPVSLPAGSIDNKRRVDFRLEDFDLFIKQKGIRIKVYRTTLCPNVKSIDSSEHEVDCPLCLGNQFVDVLPFETIAVPQADQLQKPQFPEGQYDRNTILMTFERGIELQYFTLIELCDFTDVFYERIKRQRGQIDVLKYKACCINAVIGSDGKLYYAGSDYNLDPNGSVQWLANKGPQHGEIYSIHYNMKKQYRAIEAFHVDRYTQVVNKEKGGVVEMIKLPEQWKLQKDYFVERKDVKGNRLSPNLIRDEDED